MGCSKEVIPFKVLTGSKSKSKYLMLGSFKSIPNDPIENIVLLSELNAMSVGVGTKELSFVADQKTSLLLIVLRALPAKRMAKMPTTRSEVMPPEMVL